MLIQHNGKEFNTIHYDDTLTDSECEEIRQNIFCKPDYTLVEKQLKIIRSSKKVNFIIEYFLRSIMNDSKNKNMKWTVNEFLQSNDLIRFLSGKVKNNPSFYTSKNKYDNLKTVLRLSPSGTAQTIPNFPFEKAKEIICKYNVNNNYYDYSCGWGVRLLASLANNVNYFGTDPNTNLCEGLNNIYSAFNNVFSNSLVEQPTAKIYNQGSEIFVPDLENKIGLAFSSPPYFDLELYSLNDENGQSTKDRNYEMWLTEYWEKTVKNIKLYLINGGYFLLNVKNSKEYMLMDDMADIIIENGFEFIQFEQLKGKDRPSLKLHDKNTDEMIAVFKKI